MRRRYFKIEVRTIRRNGAEDSKYSDKEFATQEEAVNACEWEIVMDRRNRTYNPSYYKDVEYYVNEVEIDEQFDEDGELINCEYEYPSGVLVGTYNEDDEEEEEE